MVSVARGVAEPTLVVHLQELLQAIVDRLKGVSRRRVLASDGWFVNGKLFALVSRQARVVVRLPDVAAQDELLAVDGAEPWQIGNKAPMRGWIQLPEAFHDDEESLALWLNRAWALASDRRESRPRVARRTSK